MNGNFTAKLVSHLPFPQAPCQFCRDPIGRKRGRQKSRTSERGASGGPKTAYS